MRHIIPLNTSAALSGASLILLSSIRDASARLVTSSDLREQVMENKSFAKVNGDECFTLETGTPNNEDVSIVDIGILGCGETLTCVKDKSSSTGARCVEFKEVFVEWDCLPGFAVGCSIDSDCCGDLYCVGDNDPHYRYCNAPGLCYVKDTFDNVCNNDSDCCDPEVLYCKKDEFWWLSKCKCKEGKCAYESCKEEFEFCEVESECCRDLYCKDEGNFKWCI